MKKRLIVCVALVLVASCQSIVSMPTNVALGAADQYGGAHFESVDFSFASAHLLSFPQVKVCAAENISNSEIVLTDSSASSVGLFTGTYYQVGNSQKLGGGPAISYIDENMRTLLADGNASYVKTSGMIPMTTHLRFRVKIQAGEDRIGMVFTNIAQALGNTGSGKNDGFFPVGNWTGADPMDAYTALESLATKLRRCIEAQN